MPLCDTQNILFVGLYSHCICQHLHMTLFSRIFSFHLNLMPLNGFHFGDVNFCLKNMKIEIKIREVWHINQNKATLDNFYHSFLFLFIFFLYQNMIFPYLEIPSDIAVISIMTIHKLLLSITKFFIHKNFLPTKQQACLHLNFYTITQKISMAQFSIQK